MNIENWQVTSGCTSLGGGCVSCPSLMEYKNKGWDYKVKVHHERVAEPMLVDDPTCFIVSLGSDLFHEDVSDDFIKSVFTVMNKADYHHFEIATKRVKRLADMSGSLKWTENIMIGTSVETENHKWRIDYLCEVPTENRFISFAPLLGNVGKVDLSGIKIAGGSGEEWELKRPFDPEWLANIRKQCEAQKTQWIESFSIYETEDA